MQVEAYLFFNGRCEEAVKFYAKAIGATDVELLRFKDAPERPPPGAVPPGSENKVMHGTFRIGTTTVMVSDGNHAAPAVFQGFGLAITVATEADAKRLFGGLTDGGTVVQPLAKTFFSPCFGMVTDRFGVLWMVVTMA